MCGVLEASDNVGLWRWCDGSQHGHRASKIRCSLYRVKAAGAVGVGDA